MGAFLFWLSSCYGALAAGSDPATLPLPWLVVPELDVKTGDFKYDLPESYDIAGRIMFRTAMLACAGIGLVIGGGVALYFRREQADYQITLYNFLAILAGIACVIQLDGLLGPALFAGVVGFLIGGRRVFWPSVGIAAVVECIIPSAGWLLYVF